MRKWGEIRGDAVDEEEREQRKNEKWGDER